MFLHGRTPKCPNGGYVPVRHWANRYEVCASNIISSCQLDSSFLLHYLLSDTFNHQIALAMSSRVKMPKINQDELGKVLLPLPPLAEQKRIAARLEELLPLCEKLK